LGQFILSHYRPEYKTIAQFFGFLPPDKTKKQGI